jgi:hypothetical protein
MDGARYRIVSGKIIPPIPPAVHAMPVANPRFSENQCPIAETLGVNSKDADRPPRTPKDRKNW